MFGRITLTKEMYWCFIVCIAIRTVDLLLFQRDIAFYLRTEFCVKFYTEKSANLYFKFSDVVI